MVSEVIDPGTLKQIPGQFGRLTNIPADIQHVVNKVPGFTTSQGALFLVIALQKKLKQFLVIIQSIVFENPLENGDVLLPGGRGYMKSVPHPTQKGLIH
jgi:hypothetical protein